MKIESPDTGEQLTINPRSDYRLPREHELDIPEELDRVPDGILRMDDQPEGVSQGQWKTFLSATFEAVQARNALQAPLDTFGVKRFGVAKALRQIDANVIRAQAEKIAPQVVELLAGTGLRVAPRPCSLSDTFCYQDVYRRDVRVGWIKVSPHATAETIASLTKQAAGL